MKIETKFNIGDKFWCCSKGENSFEIHPIIIVDMELHGSVCDEIVIHYLFYNTVAKKVMKFFENNIINFETGKLPNCTVSQDKRKIEAAIKKMP